MDYLQYLKVENVSYETQKVLNLIINGLPSIQQMRTSEEHHVGVLNLIINGLPSIRQGKGCWKAGQ